MKPNRKITKQVAASVKDFRATIIAATIQLCRQIDRHDTGMFSFKKPIAIVSTRVSGTRIVNESELSDRMYYWWGDEHYIVSFGYDDEERSLSSHMLSLDSLVAVYEAVKKAVSSY